MSNGIRVLLADDHSVVRAGFARLLEAETNIVVAAEVDSGESAIHYVKTKPVDVVVTDINMDDMDGISTTSRIKKIKPATKVAILSIHETEPFISKSFEAGADAYLSKKCAPEELSIAIKEIYAGNNYMSSDIARCVAFGKIDSEKNKIKSLTPREYEVFRLLAKGKSIAEIAERIHISPKTCYVHRTKLLTKLGLSNSYELGQMAERNNIS